MIEMRWKSLRASALAIAASIGVVAIAAPAPALAQNACTEEGGPSKTLDPRIAQALGAIYEKMQADLYQEALADLNALMAQRGENMKPFDRATTLELRGSVKAQLEDYRGAQRDFQAALDTGALPLNRNNQLRYFVAQLYFQDEQYQQAINGLNQWIQFARQCGQTVDTNAYYLLAAAYVQLSPPNYRAALGPAEQAKAGAPEPRKSYYDLLNLIYSELNETTKRISLLEEMVNYWPGFKSYWTQLSGAYSTSGRDREAFTVLEVAYRAGLLTTESELITLVQYYSYFDNPYRGAKMLEREMGAGNINRNQKNLVLLSQLWSQSREHKKSIPILREAAGSAPNGELYYRLGQVLLADEQYGPAERALTNALNRGGMDRDDTGDAWLLLGTARFSQAGPEDLAGWNSARQAFVNAQRYDKSRQQATSWIAYVDAVRRSYVDGKILEWEQQMEQCEDELSRIETQQRIRELQNTRPAEEDLQREQATIARCEALEASGRPTSERILASSSSPSQNNDEDDDEESDGEDE